MISFINVGSGSKGNATIIFDEETLIQIDMGLTKKRVVESLSTINKSIEDLQGVLITHEHVDHVKNIHMYKGKVPIYASEGTLDCYDCKVVPEESFEIGTLTIIPFQTSHDAANPVGYVIFSGDSKLVYMTDTGCIPDDSFEYLKNADYYIVESNHDLKMLMDSHRPACLKRRIKGDYGHLSNIDSAIYMSECISNKTKAIYLAHLSEECNIPELALESYKKTFKRKKVQFEVPVICLEQHSMVRGGDK
ncbi:MAG: MBL fold metallo-hydrolase [Bacilli bacterium]|nr:MBL fold metallo-hydrolase [Bacilli bacterium]